MTDILFDQPYNSDGRDAFVPRLKHFYLVYEDIASINEDRTNTYQQLSETLPQWAVLHIYTRETLFGANQPVFTEDYAVVYFTIDMDGNRVPVTTMLSEFSFADVTYAQVSA